MLWLQHLFLLCLLAHMLWAAVLLQREWQRARRHGDPTHAERRESVAAPEPLADPEAAQANAQQ